MFLFQVIRFNAFFCVKYIRNKSKYFLRDVNRISNKLLNYINDVFSVLPRKFNYGLIMLLRVK
jgi:hypothetical protein